MTCNNFEISLVVFMPNITTNHAITYINRYITSHMKCLQIVTKYPYIMLFTNNYITLKHIGGYNADLISFTAVSPLVASEK